MLTHVKDGTGAGRKMHRPTAPRDAWRCTNGHLNQPWAATCLAFGCREKRPRKERHDV